MTLAHLHLLAGLALACDARRALMLSENERREMVHEGRKEHLYDHQASQEAAPAASQHPLPALQKSQENALFREQNLSRGVSILFQALTQAAAFKPFDDVHGSESEKNAEDDAREDNTTDRGMAAFEDTIFDEKLTEMKNEMADVKFQKFAEDLTKQLNNPVNKFIESMMEDPDLKEQATRLIEYINAWRSEADFESRHPEVKAMMEDLNVQEQEQSASPVKQDAADANTTRNGAGKHKRMHQFVLPNMEQAWRDLRIVDHLMKIKARLEVSDEAKRIAILILAGSTMRYLICSACKHADKQREMKELVNYLMAEPGFQELTENVDEQMEELLSDPNIREQVKRIAGEMKTFMMDPASKQLKRVDEDMRSMMADANFQERAKLVEEHLKAKMASISAAEDAAKSTGAEDTTPLSESLAEIRQSHQESDSKSFHPRTTLVALRLAADPTAAFSVSGPQTHFPANHLMPKRWRTLWSRMVQLASHIPKPTMRDEPDTRGPRALSFCEKVCLEPQKLF